MCCESLGPDYEYLTFLTPQELTSIALCRVKTKNNVTREGNKDYSRVFLEQSKFPYPDVHTVHKIIRSTEPPIVDCLV